MHSTVTAVVSVAISMVLIRPNASLQHWRRAQHLSRVQHVVFSVGVSMQIGRLTGSFYPKTYIFENKITEIKLLACHIT